MGLGLERVRVGVGISVWGGIELVLVLGRIGVEIRVGRVGVGIRVGIGENYRWVLGLERIGVVVGENYGWVLGLGVQC